MRATYNRYLLILFLAILPLILANGGKAKKPAPAKPKADIVDQLQKQWNATKSFKATFKQNVLSKQLSTEDKSQGTIYIVKPDKLRWISDTERSVQILNGKKLVVIQENRRRKTRIVEIIDNVDDALDTKILSFLTGKAKFKSLYKIKLISETDKLSKVQLTPKKGGKDIYLVEINKKTHFLHSLTNDGPDTKVHIVFSDIYTNKKLDPKLFEYVPKRTDRVHRQQPGQ